MSSPVRMFGGEGGDACGEADAEVFEGAGAVSFEGEDVFAGLEDRFDALANRGKVGAMSLFVFASRSGDRGVECFEVLFELGAAEVFVSDQDQHLAGLALAARDHLQADEFLVDFGRGQRERPRGHTHARGHRHHEVRPASGDDRHPLAIEKSVSAKPTHVREFCMRVL
jgi:hypothetical protein